LNLSLAELPRKYWNSMKNPLLNWRMPSQKVSRQMDAIRVCGLRNRLLMSN